MSNSDKRQRSATINIHSNESTPLISKSQTDNNGSGSSTLIQQDQHNKKKEIIGLLYMTLSALGFSTMSLFVKLSGTSFPSFEIVFARSVIQTFFSLLGCAILKINPLGEKGVRKWLLFRGLAGTLGLCLFFYSITQLPLADATGKQSKLSTTRFLRSSEKLTETFFIAVVFFLGPMFTALGASLVLGEPFSLFDGICSISCMIGVILVSKPQFLFGGSNGSEDNGHSGENNNELQRLFAIFCALLGAIMSAVAYVTVRKIGRGAHFMVHVVYFGLVSAIVAPIGMFLFQKPVMPHGSYEYGMLILVGLSAFIGQCFLNQG